MVGNVNCWGFLQEQSTRGSVRQTINRGFEGGEGKKEESNVKEESANENGGLSFRENDTRIGFPEQGFQRF